MSDSNRPDGPDRRRYTVDTWIRQQEGQEVGVFIDYAFRSVCSEEELLERLRRLRRKLKKLPFRSVGKLQRVDPAYRGMQLKVLEHHPQPHSFPLSVFLLPPRPH
jgi:hypothetical protein